MNWYDRYMYNLVAIGTLNKLVNAGKLTQEEVNKMVADRMEEFGY